MAPRLSLEVLENRTVPAVLGYSVRSDFDDTFHQIDMETGATTEIGPVGFPSVDGLAFQPGTNVLYGVDDETDQLLTINLATGVGTLVGNLGADVSQPGLSFDSDGNLYLADKLGENLYAVNADTGAATLIGPMGEAVTGLTFRDGVLYGLGAFTFKGEAVVFGGNNLVRIDTATGAATEVGQLGLSFFVDGGGIDFDEAGVLWGLKNFGEGDLIFRVDPATGAATATNHTLFGFEGLAITAPALNEEPLPPPPPPPIDPCDVSAEGVGIIQALYRKILCREADQGGLEGYSVRLVNGESVESIANEIWNSQEHREIQVTDYFEAFLGRSPDPAELPDLAKTLSEFGEQGFLAALLGSPEYQSLHPTDADWLDSVYNQILGRAPDELSQGYLDRLAAGESRTDVALEILTSDETLLHFIGGQYEHSLERTPGEGEVLYIPDIEWGRIDFRSYALQILSSQEFIDLAL